jgi:hypothetical protein
MQRIHHATVKKAEKHGIILSNEGEQFKAHWPQLNKVIVASTAGHALSAMILAKRFGEEYPQVIVDCNENMIGVAFVADGEPVSLYQSSWDEYNEDDAFTLALEEASDLELDLSHDDDEETISTVVPQKYKQEYKKRGNPDNCSDWLAQLLQDYTGTRNEKGKRVTDISAMQNIAQLNGIDRDWPHLNNGQRAMNWRNMLRKRVFEAQAITLPDGEASAPQEWLDAMAKRFKTVAKKK